MFLCKKKGTTNCAWVFHSTMIVNVRNDEMNCFFSNFYSHLNTLLLQKHHTVVNVHYPSSHPHKAIDNAGDNTVDNSKKKLKTCGIIIPFVCYV